MEGFKKITRKLLEMMGIFIILIRSCFHVYIHMSKLPNYTVKYVSFIVRLLCINKNFCKS